MIANIAITCYCHVFLSVSPSIYMSIQHDSLHARNACLPTFRSRWLPVRLPDCLNQPIEVFICFHSNKQATVSYERPVQIITEMQRLASIQVKIECISNGHHQLPHSHMVLSYRSQTVRRPTADAFICLSVSHIKSHLWPSLLPTSFNKNPIGQPILNKVDDHIMSEGFLSRS